LILYRCLTGVLPTEAENLGQVLKIILTTQFRPVTELAPNTPPGLAKLVTHMLISERAARPQTMEQVVDALKALEWISPPSNAPSSSLRGGTESDPSSVVAAEVYTPEAQRDQPARSKRTRSGVAAAVGLLLTGTAIVALTRGRPASPDDASPDDASPNDASPDDASPDDASPDDASPNGRTGAGERPVTPSVPNPVGSPGPLFATAERTQPPAGRRPIREAPASSISVSATASVAQPSSTKPTLQGAVAKDVPF
jgi:hypothetical protein